MHPPCVLRGLQAMIMILMIRTNRALRTRIVARTVLYAPALCLARTAGYDNDINDQHQSCRDLVGIVARIVECGQFLRGRASWIHSMAAMCVRCGLGCKGHA